MSKLFVAPQDKEILRHKNILLDTDFIAECKSEETFFEQITNELIGLETVFLLTPITRLEFLRDAFLPNEIARKMVFLDNFTIMASHQEIDKKIQEHALILSRIYKHQGCKNNPSLPDLLLGGTMITYNENILLLTGNRKDFPSILFDTEVVLTLDKPEPKSFYILKLNLASLQDKVRLLQELPTISS